MAGVEYEDIWKVDEVDERSSSLSSNGNIDIDIGVVGSSILLLILILLSLCDELFLCVGNGSDFVCIETAPFSTISTAIFLSWLLTFVWTMMGIPVIDHKRGQMLSLVAIARILRRSVTTCDRMG